MCVQCIYESPQFVRHVVLNVIACSVYLSVQHWCCIVLPLSLTTATPSISIIDVFIRQWLERNKIDDGVEPSQLMWNM